MKKKRFLCGVLLSLAVCAVSPGVGLVVQEPVVAEATGLDDNLGEPVTQGSDSASPADDNGVADYIKNHRAMTSDQMNKASQALSPITNIFGYIIGGIMVLVSAGIFVITAIDILYIGLPPFRNLLYKPQNNVQGGGMMPGGYGAGRYGMAGGQQQASGGSGIQWISDEARQCAMLLNSADQPAVGSGMGMGMGMGPTQMNSQNAQQMSTKSVIGIYFKKRVFFLIIFAVCSVMLTSSIFIGTGVNIAKWGMQIMNMVNDFIANIKM